MESVLLSTAYFPPVSYFVLIARSNSVRLEAYENFLKQTYRNRCVIYSANGPINLVIPVKHSPDLKTGIRKIQVTYEQNWQQLHFRAIESAYRNSPYYEYYISEFQPFFSHQTPLLFDLNTQILKVLFSVLNMDVKLLQTTEYHKPTGANYDFRYSISPKQPSPLIKVAKYHQVFADKFGFVPDLSVLDLIFNQGPDSQDIIRNCRFS